jgi:hypothetical protein
LLGAIGGIWRRAKDIVGESKMQAAAAVVANRWGGKTAGVRRFCGVSVVVVWKAMWKYVWQFKLPFLSFPSG